MKKVQILFILFFTSLSPLFSQKYMYSKPTSVQLELLGSYNMVGVSFDRRFSNSYSGFGYKVGLGIGYSKDKLKFIPFKFDTWGGFPNQTILSVPLQVNYLLGEKNHQFEIGVGATPFYSTYKFNGKSHINAYGTLSAGYRYYNISKHITAGAGLMLGYKLPGLKMNYVNNVFWQPYLSIGYLF